MKQAEQLLPGLALLTSLAVIAHVLAELVPWVNSLILALVLGALLANTYGVPERATPAANLHKTLLEVGIVLLGARMTIGEIVSAGPILVGFVSLTVVFGIVFFELLSRMAFDLQSKTRSLLAGGVSICGVSAVLAIAGGIEATEEQIAYAAGTILLFDAVTLLLFPVFGEVLGLSGKTFGIWAGLSMFSTGPVAAAGFAHSPVAGKWATITKVIRNSFIGLAAISYSLCFAKQHNDDRRLRLAEVWAKFPKFLVGFLLVVAIVNLGGVTKTQVAAINTVSDWLFALAFVGLGIDIRGSNLRRVGTTPLVIVSIHLVIVSAITLLLVQLV